MDASHLAQRVSEFGECVVSYRAVPGGYAAKVYKPAKMPRCSELESVPQVGSARASPEPHWNNLDEESPRASPEPRKSSVRSLARASPEPHKSGLSVGAKLRQTELASPEQPRQTFVLSLCSKSEHKWGLWIEPRSTKYAIAVDGVPGKNIHLTRGYSYAFQIGYQEEVSFYFTNSPLGGSKTGLKDTPMPWRAGTQILNTSDLPSQFYYQASEGKLMGGLVFIHKDRESA